MTEPKIELPPLPDALHLPDGSQFFDSNYGLGSSAVSAAVGPYVASQMTAYALLAVERERERCANVVANWTQRTETEAETERLADAIRKGA